MSDSGSDAESNRSVTPVRKTGSVADETEKSIPNSPDSKRSRSRSISKSKSRSRSHSKDSSSKSRSHSRSRSKSRSKSHSKSRSRSKSHSAERSRSNSRSRSRSTSKSKSSRSPSKERSKSLTIRSKSKSLSRSRSRSKSKSRTPSRSRSNSPSLEIDEQQGSPKSPVQKKTETNKLIDTDDSEDDNNDTGGDKIVNAAAIFGDADDITDDDDDSENEKIRSDKEENRHSRSRSGSRSENNDRGYKEEEEEEIEDVQRVGDQEEEKPPEVEVIPETRIDVKVPKITCDLGRDLNFVKLPNFLSVETRPFDPETYEDEIDEEETLDEEGRARLKLKVENTIRWREFLDDEGNTKKESNARFVRWSDGSYSLHLGSEIFDVYRQPLQGDHNHLFIRQGTGLQGQAVFRTKLSFRPHSTESFTHRKMTLSLADRSQKTSGIKILSQVGVDPENDRAERLKKEEEKLRQSARPKTSRRKNESATRSYATRESFREEDGSDDDGAISLNAIKNKYKGAAAVAAAKASIYSSDEDESDLDTTRKRKSDKSRAVLKDSDEESGSD